MITSLEIEEVAELLTAAKKLVCYFKHSPMMYEKFKDTAKRLSFEDESMGRFSTLMQECPTHWNSCYNRLDRIVKLRTPIQVVLSNSDFTPSTSE